MPIRHGHQSEQRHGGGKKPEAQVRGPQLTLILPYSDTVRRLYSYTGWQPVPGQHVKHCSLSRHCRMDREAKKAASTTSHTCSSCMDKSLLNAGLHSLRQEGTA